jgi:hypothetical protein
MFTVSFSLVSATLDPNVVSNTSGLTASKKIHPLDVVPPRFIDGNEVAPSRLAGRGLWATRIVGDLGDALQKTSSTIDLVRTKLVEAAKLFDATIALGISYEPERGQGGFVLDSAAFAAPLMELLDEVNFYFLTSATLDGKPNYQRWLNNGQEIIENVPAESRNADSMCIALRIPTANMLASEVSQFRDHGFCYLQPPNTDGSKGDENHSWLVRELVAPGFADTVEKAIDHALSEIENLRKLDVAKFPGQVLGLWWAPQSGCTGYMLDPRKLAALIKDISLVDFYFASAVDPEE